MEGVTPSPTFLNSYDLSPILLSVTFLPPLLPLVLNSALFPLTPQDPTPFLDSGRPPLFFSSLFFTFLTWNTCQNCEWKWLQKKNKEKTKRWKKTNDDGINWTVWICLKSARNSRGSQQELSHLQTPMERRVIDALSNWEMLLLIGPWAILCNTCSSLHGNLGCGHPSSVGARGAIVCPPPADHPCCLAFSSSELLTFVCRTWVWQSPVSSSCWRPVAAAVFARTWKNYQQHHCVFFYSKKKNILALFILKAIVYLLWEEYKYICIQSNKPTTRG